MAKNMDPTMEDMRREQASLRAAWEKNGQKQLNAITVKLAEKENQTPIPVTMAGLRQLDRMASDMGMDRLKPVQKGAAGMQASGRVPVGMQGGAKTSEERIGDVVRAATDVGKGMHIASKFGRYQTIPTNGGPMVFGIRDMMKGEMRNGKQAGMWMFRVDKPHGPFDQHYHMNPRHYGASVKGEHFPISNNTLKLAQGADEAFKIAKAGGKALAVIGIAMDAYDIATAVSADLTDSDKRLGKKTAAAVGGAAFSWAGAAAGAALGASLGSALPGIGTAIGGLVGGFIGGIGGSLGGRALVEQIDWNE